MRGKQINRIMNGVLILSIFLISGCQKNTLPQNTALSLPAVTGAISNSITMIGNIESSQSSEIVWRTTGVVEKVNVALGDTVTAGQVLAELERDSLPSTVLNAEVPLLEAQDNLENLLVSETTKAEAYKDLRDKEVALEDAEQFAEGLNYPVASQEEIDVAKKSLDGAKDAYDNAATVYQSVVHRDNLDEQKKSLYENLQSTLTSYAQAYDLWLYYVNNTTENTKKQAAADIKVAEAAYKEALKDFKTYESGYPRERDLLSAELAISDAKDNYDKRSAVADIDGVITVMNPRSGDYVTNGTTAFRIDNLERIFIPIDISEIDIVKISDGQKATVVLDANAGKTYEGVVNKVSEQGAGTDSAVSFETYVEILNPDESVKVGMTAEIDIILEQKTNVLLVASNAILSEDGQSYVEVTDGTTTRKVVVETGLTNDLITEITSGELTAGEAVVVPSIDSDVIEQLGVTNDFMPSNTEGENLNLPAGSMPESNSVQSTAVSGNVNENE